MLFKIEIWWNLPPSLAISVLHINPFSTNCSPQDIPRSRWVARSAHRVVPPPTRCGTSAGKPPRPSWRFGGSNVLLHPELHLLRWWEFTGWSASFYLQYQINSTKNQSVLLGLVSQLPFRSFSASSSARMPQAYPMIPNHPKLSSTQAGRSNTRHLCVHRGQGAHHGFLQMSWLQDLESWMVRVFGCVRSIICLLSFSNKAAVTAKLSQLLVKSQSYASLSHVSHQSTVHLHPTSSCRRHWGHQNPRAHSNTQVPPVLRSRKTNLSSPVHYLIAWWLVLFHQTRKKTKIILYGAILRAKF